MYHSVFNLKTIFFGKSLTEICLFIEIFKYSIEIYIELGEIISTAN